MTCNAETHFEGPVTSIGGFCVNDTLVVDPDGNINGVSVDPSRVASVIWQYHSLTLSVGVPYDAAINGSDLDVYTGNNAYLRLRAHRVMFDGYIWRFQSNQEAALGGANAVDYRIEKNGTTVMATIAMVDGDGRAKDATYAASATPVLEGDLIAFQMELTNGAFSNRTGAAQMWMVRT